MFSGTLIWHLDKKGQDKTNTAVDVPWETKMFSPNNQETWTLALPHVCCVAADKPTPLNSGSLWVPRE